jgi:peptide/nickel transport system substrate-binding protein
MKALKNLEDLFAKGKISRRQFLTRAAALGMAGALPVSLLAKSSHASKPKRGGRLRMGLTGASTADDLDLGGACCDSWELNITFQTRNCLVEIDAGGRPIPELAESWESTPNAAKWIFKIRRSVEFHNGKSLDADDVVYSLNHHRGEQSKSSAKSLITFIKDIKADGKYNVVFDLDYGYADMPALMADYHFQIVPAGHENWQDGLGTGGYILKDFEPGVRAFSVRNPNYWKEGRAHFDEIECIGIHDTSARVNALKTGEIDLMDEPDLKTASILNKQSGIQVLSVTGLRHYTIPMLTDVAPFDNNDARLALKYAVDREMLLKVILQGYGSVGNDHPIAPSNRYYASELEQRKYDPEKAKYHLKKAGLEGHTFELHTADAAYTGAVDTAMLIREGANKAGIDIKVVREPDDGYWSNVWRKKPWSFCYWSGRVVEDMMFSTAYAADAAWNDANWKHERFNKLLVEARQELDDAKRREMYVEMQRIVRDEGGTVVHLWANSVFAATTKLKYEEPQAGHFELDGQKLTEKWWFA